jgi:hypothetical protein
MGRTGGGAGGAGEKIEVKDDYEWMKCANCGIFSRRPVSGGDWEPRYESTSTADVEGARQLALNMALSEPPA